MSRKPRNPLTPQLQSRDKKNQSGWVRLSTHSNPEKQLPARIEIAEKQPKPVRNQTVSLLDLASKYCQYCVRTQRELLILQNKPSEDVIVKTETCEKVSKKQKKNTKNQLHELRCIVHCAYI